MVTKKCKVLKISPFRLEVEGTDGSGKSTLMDSLKKSLHSRYPSKRIVCLPEFSDTPLGYMVGNVIKEKTFFSLGVKKSNLPLAETLCLAGDYIAKLEKLKQCPNPNPDIIISDRGIATFWVYQEMRLNKTYRNSEDVFKEWMDHMFSQIEPPDLTVILTSSEESLRQRLANRGDNVTNESMKFILTAQSKYINLASNNDNFLIIENSDGNLHEVVEKVVSAVACKIS